MAYTPMTDSEAQTISTMAMHPREFPIVTSIPKQIHRTLEPTIRR